MYSLSLSLSLPPSTLLIHSHSQSLRELVVGNLQRVNALGSVNYLNALPPNNPTNWSLPRILHYKNKIIFINDEFIVFCCATVFAFCIFCQDKIHCSFVLEILYPRPQSPQSFSTHVREKWGSLYKPLFSHMHWKRSGWLGTRLEILEEWGY